MREKVKEFIKVCKKSILFYTFVYSILFFISKLILNILDLDFMQYAYKFSIFVILFGIVLGIIQSFIRSKSKSIRICIIVCSIGIISICALFWQFFALSYIGLFPPEHIIEKSDKKMVGYVHAFLHTKVEYYEYINVLVRKANKSYIEDYGKGGFDPFCDKIGNNHDIKEITYYDENGKVISTNNISNPNILDSNKQEINREEFKEEDSNKRYISEDETMYTAEQLKRYEKDFNSFAINGFVVSTNTYNKPSEIDLEEVFYSGAGFNNEISKEELEEYKKVTKYHETDIVKITTEQAEELYYDNTGEKLQNLKERLKNWTYIEKYDAYYNEISDTNFESVSCIEGIMNEEYSIMKIKLSNNRTISVKIDYDKGTHYIISNKSTN